MKSANGDSIDGYYSVRSRGFRLVRGVGIAPATVGGVVGQMVTVRGVVHVVRHVVVKMASVGIVQSGVAHHGSVLVLFPLGALDVLCVLHWGRFAAVDNKYSELQVGKVIAQIAKRELETALGNRRRRNKEFSVGHACHSARGFS